MVKRFFTLFFVIVVALGLWRVMIKKSEIRMSENISSV